MNNFAPLVSIVIPVYNGSNYLAEAIDSALAQTYLNIEILVINDGSKDDGATRDIALSYGSRIRYFEKENGGVATALNLGIAEMKGDYFSWLSHDDKYFPDKIEKQIKFLSKLDLKDVVLYSDIEFIDQDSKFLFQLKLPHYPPESFRPVFIKDPLINGCTLLVPKICFEKCGLFNPLLRTTQDYDLWFRFSNKFKFVHQPDVLVQSRKHKDQDSTKLQETFVEERDNLFLFFINNVSQKEIKNYSRGNISGYYISFATMMTAYMCLKSEKCAIRKSIECLLKSDFRYLVFNFIKLITLFVIFGARKLFIVFFGFNSLLKFKRAILNSKLMSLIKK
jgi:hypothetical protein